MRQFASQQGTSNDPFQNIDLIQHKREAFHINIRKSKREEIFKIKRHQIFIQTTLTSPLDKLLSEISQLSGLSFLQFGATDTLREITQLTIQLLPMVEESFLFQRNNRIMNLFQNCIQYFTQLDKHLIDQIDESLINTLCQLLEQLLLCQKSFLKYDIQEEQFKWDMIDLIMYFFMTLSYHRENVGNYFIDREELILEVINRTDLERVIQNVKKLLIYLFQQVLIMIGNLVYDYKIYIKEFLEKDILQKSLTKVYELQYLNSERTIDALLYLIGNLTYQYELFQGYELNFVIQLIYFLLNKKNISNSSIKQCFKILQNISQELPSDGQRCRILIKQLIDCEIISQVIGLLLTSELEYIQEGYQFLMNISLINDNPTMKVCCQLQNPLSYQQNLNQINGLKQIQESLFIILANIFTSTVFIKQSIIEEGVCSRIVTAYDYQISTINLNLLREIIHCIINAVHQCSQDQLCYFYEQKMLHCLVNYFSDFSTEQWDIPLIQEIIEIIEFSAINLPDFLDYCKLNHSFQLQLQFLLKQDIEDLVDPIEKLMILL